MSKRKRARDECSICKANGTNAIGHLAQWCAYKDGPFEGNFKGAIQAKKESEKRAKTANGLGGVAQNAVSAELASLKRTVLLDRESKCIALQGIISSVTDVEKKYQSVEEKQYELKDLAMETKVKFDSQEKVINQMKLIITQLQAEVAQLKKIKQRQIPGQSQWRYKANQNWNYDNTKWY